MPPTTTVTTTTHSGPSELSDLDYEEELLEAQMELADDLEQLIGG